MNCFLECCPLTSQNTVPTDHGVCQSKRRGTTRRKLNRQLKSLAVQILAFDTTHITQPIATLIAAGVALAVSLLTLGISLRSGSASAKRGAFRDLISAHFAIVSSALHEVVATATVLLKTRSPRARESWVRRGNEAKKKLLDVRTQLRIPLGAMDEGFRTLARLPNWTVHSERYPKHSAALLDAGDRLRAVLDQLLLEVYLQGKPLGFFQSWRASHATKRLGRV